MARVKAGERRSRMWDLIKNTDIPLSGKYLSEVFGVSRQIVVSDIQVLREDHPELISTVKGYITVKPEARRRIFKVNHSDEETFDEMLQIVNLGGRLIDVVVQHKVYGTIQKPLDIGSKRVAEYFISDIKSGVSGLLKNLTDGYHYHTVEAATEKDLDLIEQMLKKKGYYLETVEFSEVYEPKRYDRS